MNVTYHLNNTQNTTEVTTMTATTNKKVEFVDVEILPRGVHWFLNSLMVLATLLGFLGNGLVCHFFAKKSIRLKPFNMLLLNLSIADLLADFFAYPQIFVELTMLRQFSARTADILCAFTIGITPFAMVTYVSVFTLTYISVNRYVFIKYPLKTSWFKSKRNTAWFIVAAWIFAIGFVFPNAIAFKYDAKYAVCYRVWPENFNGFVWTVIGLFFGLILPNITMLLAFIATMRHFRKKTMVTNEDASVLARKRGAIILLGFLILAFFVCWGPSFVYLTLSLAVESIWPPGVDGEYVRMRIIRVVFLVALTNSVADPFIYAYKNPEFRKCFTAFCQRFKPKRQKAERSHLSKDTSTTSV